MLSLLHVLQLESHDVAVKEDRQWKPDNTHAKAYYSTAPLWLTLKV